jgi:predicted TIM-barrel fold metal-dependent hydrolase
VSQPARICAFDADGHVIEPPSLWPEYLERKYHDRMPRPIRDEAGRFCYAVGGIRVMRTASALAVAPRDHRGAPRAGGLPPGGFDPEARLRDMDAEGIEAAVLYPTLGFFFPEVGDPELHAALCRAYNDWLADYARRDPERLIGVALLPLDDVVASVRELERTTERFGFRAAFVRPNPYAGRSLADSAYDPFWECAAAQGVAIAIHEGISDALPTLGRERSASPVIQHLMSHPFEQMAACAAILLEGVAERHPALRFAFLESGSGWLPYWLDRLDGHWETWGSKLAARRRPSEAFRAQCFVSMDPDDGVAPDVARSVGDEVLVWASDYPHVDAPFPGAVEKTLETLGGLPVASRRRILRENALRLYGLTTRRAKGEGSMAGGGRL